MRRDAVVRRRFVGRDAAVTFDLDALRQQVVMLTETLTVVQQRLTTIEARLPRDRDDADERLRVQLATSTNGRAFKAVDLLRHADVDEALKSALADATIAGTVELGAWLRDHVGQRHGVVIERLRSRHWRTYRLHTLRVDD